MLSPELRSLIWAATVIGVCVLALRRGGPDERQASGVMLAAWAVSMVVGRSGYTQTEWGILAIDVTALVGFTVIALRSDRYWPLFAAGFHLLAILTHLARGVDDTVATWAYFTAQIMWGYLLAGSIGYGALTTPRAPRSAIPADRA